MLSPQRDKDFGSTGAMVFLALYALTVLGFASIYHGTYLANPNAFRLDMAGAEITNEEAEIKKILQRSSNNEEAMSAENEKYKMAQLDAEMDATQCIEIPIVGPKKDWEPPNYSGLPIEKFYRTETHCYTDKNRQTALFDTYTKNIDMTKVRDFINLQERRDRLGILTYIDFLYFSTVTSATVGYGDITPKTGMTKLTVIGQIAINFFLTLVLVNLFINPTQRNKQ